MHALKCRISLYEMCISPLNIIGAGDLTGFVSSLIVFIVKPFSPTESTIERFFLTKQIEDADFPMDILYKNDLGL